MKRLFYFPLLTSVVCMAQALDLQEALRRSASQVSAEDAEAVVARSRLAWLEASKGRKIEITPQMAVWGVINPLSLAPAIGANTLTPGSVTPLTILDAKIDLTTAELQAERQRLNREAQVSEQFATLAQLQQLQALQCDAEADAIRKRDQTRQEVSRARATQIELLESEQEVLRRKEDCSRVSLDREIAANALATSLGMNAAELQVETPKTPGPVNATLRSSADLLSIAALHRSPSTDFDPRIRALWAELEDVRDRQIRLVIKDNGAFDAQKQLASAKIRRLEVLSHELADSLRARTSDIRARADASRQRLELARKRAKLIAGQEQAAEARMKAGLATRGDVVRAQDAARASQWEVASLESEGLAHWTALLVACGLQDQPLVIQAQLFEEGPLSAGIR